MALLLSLVSDTLRISKGKCYIFYKYYTLLCSWLTCFIYILLYYYYTVFYYYKYKWLRHDWYQPKWMLGESVLVHAWAHSSGFDTCRVVQKAGSSARDYFLFCPWEQKCSRKSIAPSRLWHFPIHWGMRFSSGYSHKGFLIFNLLSTSWKVKEWPLFSHCFLVIRSWGRDLLDRNTKIVSNLAAGHWSFLFQIISSRVFV